MSARTGNGKPRPARGLALVEFVLLAPLLLALLLAVAEMGRALYQYNTLAKAVYAGARYYAANVLADEAAAEAKAALLVQYGDDTGAGQPLLPPPLPAVACSHLNSVAKVSASYTFTPLPGDPLGGMLRLLGGADLPSPFTLTASVALRAL